MNGSSRDAISPVASSLVHSCLQFMKNLPWCSAPLSSPDSAALTTVDGAEDRGYSKLPTLEEMVAAYLCPPSALSLKVHAAHPSKPFGATSALANRAYAASGQSGSALHSMVVLQVFQAKLLRSMDESGQDHDAFKELHTATELDLLATKAMAQEIGKTMANLVVLDCHL